MAFAPPKFPLTCNIWQALGGTFPRPAGPPNQAGVACQLRMVKSAWAVNNATQGGPVMLLLLPPKTDIRPANAASTKADLVECPSGTGRFYSVVSVDDVAKGFPNEYRCAAIVYAPQRATMWPFPTP